MTRNQESPAVERDERTRNRADEAAEQRDADEMERTDPQIQHQILREDPERRPGQAQRPAPGSTASHPPANTPIAAIPPQDHDRDGASQEACRQAERQGGESADDQEVGKPLEGDGGIRDGISGSDDEE